VHLINFQVVGGIKFCQMEEYKNELFFVAIDNSIVPMQASKQGLQELQLQTFPPIVIAEQVQISFLRVQKNYLLVGYQVKLDYNNIDVIDIPTN